MISVRQEGKSSPARFGGARVQTLGFFTACVGLSAVLPLKLEPDFHLLRFRLRAEIPSVNITMAILKALWLSLG
jgi:hypothetical protein